jgi:hypothetical protein
LFPGKNPRTVLSGTPAYEKAVELIKQDESNPDTFLSIIDPLMNIRKHVSNLFNISDNGEVFVGSDKLPACLGSRLFDFAETGFLPQAKSLILFWNNCKANPDPRTQTDLYAFLEKNNLPITDDGCFVAYRAVQRNENGDLVDARTGQMVNNVGCIVSMPRENCDSNPNNTCSSGLHAAGFEYAKNFSRILLNVKINPKDVVAIPTDYNNAKLRCCQFEVLAINSEDPTTAKLISEPLVKVSKEDDYLDHVEDDSDEEYDEDDLVEQYIEDDENKIPLVPSMPDLPSRDKFGRFIGKTSNKNPPKRDKFGRFLPKA